MFDFEADSGLFLDENQKEEMPDDGTGMEFEEELQDEVDDGEINPEEENSETKVEEKKEDENEGDAKNQEEKGQEPKVC